MWIYTGQWAFCGSLPSPQSTVTRQGWPSCSSSSSSSSRPPSSRPSLVASDCPGLAGRTLSAKEDHVSWGPATKLKPSRRLWTTQNCLPATFLNCAFWFFLPSTLFYLNLAIKQLCKLWNCGTGGFEENVQPGLTFHRISSSIALCCKL